MKNLIPSVKIDTHVKVISALLIAAGLFFLSVALFSCSKHATVITSNVHNLKQGSKFIFGAEATNQIGKGAIIYRGNTDYFLISHTGVYKYQAGNFTGMVSMQEAETASSQVFAYDNLQSEQPITSTLKFGLLVDKSIVELPTSTGTTVIQLNPNSLVLWGSNAIANIAIAPPIAVSGSNAIANIWSYDNSMPPNKVLLTFDDFEISILQKCRIGESFTLTVASDGSMFCEGYQVEKL